MSAPVPLWRVMGANSFLLSVLYLALGTGVELGRRLAPSRPLLRVSLALDALPARAMELVGVLEPLRQAYYAGQVSERGVRMAFILATLVIIHALAFLVGAGMWLLRGRLQRRAA